MESRLFTTILDDSTSESALAFTRHLEELLQLSSDAREACLKALYKFRLARTKRQTRELIDAIADGQGVPAAAIQHSLSILGFLVDALLNESIPDDDHTLWAEDLDSEWGISGDDRQVFESVLAKLTSDRQLAAFRYQAKQRAAGGGVLPTFTRLGVTVEVRPVRGERYHWGTPVEDYEPEMLGSIEIASINIGVDEGTPKDLYFQADENDLDDIISSLRAAKKEMAALREYLGLDASSRGETNA